MPIHYCQSAHRHYQDGRYLQDDRRQPNADHHFGVAAECAVKALLVGLGVQTDPAGNIDRSYRHHLGEAFEFGPGSRGSARQTNLCAEFGMYLRGHRGARYLPKLPEGEALEDLFADWSIDQRYCESDDIRAAQVHTHARAARALLSCLERAQQDGIVS